MPKERPRPESRKAILDAVTSLLRERRAGDATIDDVARRASCAKGLVHYHFKRKDQLMAAAAADLWESRSRAWTAALDRPDPKDAIANAWRLLRSEASTGTAAACAALGFRSDEMVVQSVNSARSSFARSVTEALDGLLTRMNLVTSVPAGELGTLLGATAEGIGLQLASGADPSELEQAWAAFWVGLLSLTAPKHG